MAAESSAQSSSTLPLQDRVAIVTGASRGIGKEIALHLASLGAKVVINYTSNATLAQEVVNQINCHGPDTRAVAVQADVSDPAQVEALFNAAEEAFHAQPHVVVTNAGIIDPKYPSIAETTVENFDNIIGVNLKGTFLCCKEAAKRIKRDGGGRIITFSSSLAAVFRPGFGAYTASKAAVEAMTKILAKELKGTRITANCVAPGPVATELFFSGATEEHIQGSISASPMQRLGEPKDIAPLVGFLAGDSSEWVNGQIIRANGGFV
ncbi:NADPH-dependent aldehyde reductase-like protein, chloroplastic [Beta vulgaris subsp. vulgaris]|uniref:NADPH-dependent aldehyde reductase-like protein, chloroplastic n=1 Tax=Beta vulgaris subsp. vulgaris TaxID=3555 RepID=UPI002036CED1|nr:NADPH-dependent aldehyde reductase-like protein, chloroplastic [Beta vulgaris subsp. vulgaris]